MGKLKLRLLDGGRRKGCVMNSVQVTKLEGSLLKGKIRGLFQIGNTLMASTMDDENPIINVGEFYVPALPVKQAVSSPRKGKAGRPSKATIAARQVSQQQPQIQELQTEQAA